MAREMITINVGGAGVSIGEAVARQYMTEHHIELDGTPGGGFDDGNSGLTTFFKETGGGSFTPRGLWVDLEPSAVDRLRNGPEGLSHPEFLLNGKEDASNNFAKGYSSVGRGMLDSVNDRLRKLTESCENFQGFMMHHSLGGGTGSGLGSLILERLKVDYRKKTTIGLEVLAGNPLGAQTPCASYNQTLATHKLLDRIDVSLLFDNSQLGSMCKELDIKISYEHVNSLIARVSSAATSKMRFAGEVSLNLDDFVQNLVPFPRLHFCTCSVPGFKKSGSKGLRESSGNALQTKNMTLKFTDFDVIEDKYMGMMMNFRGDISGKTASDTADELVQSGKLNFVEWIPTNVKAYVVDTPQPKAEGIRLETEELGASMVGNNVAVSRVFTRTSKKFDMLYSQKAYVHHFLADGMEEGDLVEAREDLGFLEKDYLDVLTEQADDEEEDDDDFR